ncbi:MAG: fatty acid desaturase [Quisquiliibacterium sp.]
MIDSVISFLTAGLVDASIWQMLAYTLVTTHITIAAVTIYLHRCQAHRALDLHPVVSHFFRAWLWLTTGMITREWASIHRKHHAKCETAEDPHSPQVRGLRKVLLEGVELYRAEAADRETVDKYGHGCPDDWIERNLYASHSAAGVYLTLAIDLLLFGVAGAVVFAVQMLWIPVLAAGVINGLGHWWGYRNWDCADASTNILPWGILIGGEELHNNHHAYASSAKLSSKWYEFDIGWLYIRVLSFFGLATVRRVAATPRLVAARQTVDLQTLSAVIAHRYDLMAQFAGSLKRVCVQEAARLRPHSLSQGRLIDWARRWLPGDAARWSEDQKSRLSEIFAVSDPLKKLVEMRAELGTVWERSNLSREQLLLHLQNWCAQAEESGVRALEDIALRVRRYAA